jgi:hypothetical protein
MRSKHHKLDKDCPEKFYSLFFNGELPEAIQTSACLIPRRREPLHRLIDSGVHAHPAIIRRMRFFANRLRRFVNSYVENAVPLLLAKKGLSGTVDRSML